MLPEGKLAVTHGWLLESDPSLGSAGLGLPCCRRDALSSSPKLTADATSLKVRRKSLIIFPAVRAISMDLLGPRARKATRKITNISGRPIPKKFKRFSSVERGIQCGTLQAPA